MPDQTMIDDVRAAKIALDARLPTFEDLQRHLARVASDYEARRGEFANVPKTRPEWVQRMIDQAADEPGREMLAELRPAP